MSNHPISIIGLGAVSPAGWGVASLFDAVSNGKVIPASELERPGWSRGLPVRKVPPPPSRPAFLAHPRLRRASPISHFTVAAALEALGNPQVPSPAPNLGIIFCTMAGPLNYTRRFYTEALRDPATASPMLFPETVLNAPASHLAALLGVTGPVYTLIGDDTAPLSALALAAQWLNTGKVERCLVVASEELDWLPADAFRLFLHDHIAAEGAGALLLARHHEPSPSQWMAVTDPFNYAMPGGNRVAVQSIRKQCQTWDAPTALLCDSRIGIPRRDRAENEAWSNWPGQRWSPRCILGDALTASSVWQAVLAAAAVSSKSFTQAVVHVAGCNHQAVAALCSSRE